MEAERANRHHLIEVAAFFLWEERNRDGRPGDASGDWFIAEEEIRESYPTYTWSQEVWWNNISGGITTHVVKIRLDFPDILICPIRTCGFSLGEGRPIEEGMKRCPCCGAIIEAIYSANLVI